MDGSTTTNKLVDRAPLIPKKKNQFYADVAPVIREIFRTQITGNTSPSDCDLELEKVLQDERELRVARALKLFQNEIEGNSFNHGEPLKLHALDLSLRFDTKDLVPTVLATAGDASQWVRNIISPDTNNVRSIKSTSSLRTETSYTPANLQAIPTCPSSVSQTISIECATEIKKPRRAKEAKRELDTEPRLLAVFPNKLSFVNAVVGGTYTKTIRLMNVSSKVTKVSVQPPEGPQFRVEFVAGNRSLEAGSSMRLLVTYTPSGVARIVDQIRLKVLDGRQEVVDIECYLEAPKLSITVLEPVAFQYLSSSLRENFGIQDSIYLGVYLLGCVKELDLLIDCESKHASFFMLTEKAWSNSKIEGIDHESRALKAYPFIIHPCTWKGGEQIRGTISYVTSKEGAQAVDFKIISTTRVVRDLRVFAETVYFEPEDVHLVAHEKDYDITSPYDNDSEFYLNLGIAYPGRSLNKTFEIVNDSAVTFTYHWEWRPWSKCCCPRKEEDMTVYPCEDYEQALMVEPAAGILLGHTSLEAVVRIPDVGIELGVQREVLMLVLDNIPKESIRTYGLSTQNSQLRIFNNESGVKEFEYECCDVVQCQMEVWWDVVPIRVFLEPLYTKASYSANVHEMRIPWKVTHLGVIENLFLTWVVPDCIKRPCDCRVEPLSECMGELLVTLHGNPVDEYCRLVVNNGEFEASMRIILTPEKEFPTLSPHTTYLGSYLPSTELELKFAIDNCSDNKQLDYTLVIVNDLAKCGCASKINTLKGRLDIQGSIVEAFKATNGRKDGLVATLAQLVRTEEYPAGVIGAAALVISRVHRPFLVLEVLGPCEGGDQLIPCQKGTRCVIRPLKELSVNSSVKYTIQLQNTTPVNAEFEWVAICDGYAKIDFEPRIGTVKSYGKLVIQVTIMPMKICPKWIWITSCTYKCMLRPVYLILDFEISGLEIVLEIPCGIDYPKCTYTVEVKSSERTGCGCVKRDQDLTNLCRCYEGQVPKEGQEKPCLQFVKMPLRTVYKRTISIRNVSDVETRFEAHIQNFPRSKNVPRTLDKDKWAAAVCEEGVAIDCKPTAGQLKPHSCMEVAVRVYATVWGIYHDIITIEVEKLPAFHFDIWVEAVGVPWRIPLEPRPASGGDACAGELMVLMSRAGTSEERRPVWINNTSNVPIALTAYTLRELDYEKPNIFRLYWNFVETDYVVQSDGNNIENKPDTDCSTGRLVDSKMEEQLCDCEIEEEICIDVAIAQETQDKVTVQRSFTGVGLFLGPDCGHQANDCFDVMPDVLIIQAYQKKAFTVIRKERTEVGPPTRLVIRVEPLSKTGRNWWRPRLPLIQIKLKDEMRLGSLFTPDCVTVKACAVAVRRGELMKIRKKIRIRNVSLITMQVSVRSETPVGILCHNNSLGRPTTEKTEATFILPRETTENIETVCKLSFEDLKPQVEDYDKWRTIKTKLVFSENDKVIKEVPYTINLTYPLLTVTPEHLNMGTVTFGHTFKNYFAVTHSGRTVTLDMIISWNNVAHFKVYPERFSVAPDQRVLVYVQFQAGCELSLPLTAEDGSCECWTNKIEECEITVQAREFEWCKKTVNVSADISPDYAYHFRSSDFTDDTKLLPG